MVDTVTVACKLPGGVILRVFEWVEVSYPLPGGGVSTVKESHEIAGDTRFTVQGVAHEAGKSPVAQMSDGFALTYGCPKALWDAWVEQNKSLDMVKNGLIFAHAQEASVKAMAKERVKQLSGLEPLELDSKGQMVDARAPRKIEKADV
jgi:hypothetical protein